jgi:hypothetical protein
LNSLSAILRKSPAFLRCSCLVASSISGTELPLEDENRPKITH